MKIIMMTNTYTPIVGGVERSISSFTDKFRQKGHDVLIVAPSFKDAPKHEKDVVRLPAIQKVNGTDFSVNLPIPRILSDVFQEFKPDIIHSHHPFLLGDLALRMSSNHSVPIVFTYHTMFEDYIHYLPVHNEKVKRFVVELAAGYANLTHHVIVPSESVRDVLLERKVTTPITIIPTGINIKNFRQGNGKNVREKFSISDDSYVVGHLGRLAPEKNLEFLTNCVSQLLKKEKAAHFLVVGSGPSKSEIEKKFEDKGLTERLHFTGVLRDQDLVDAYHAMDVFAFSSQSETQGVVLAETMAAGIPVVALDASGVREIVEDKVNGRLIDKEDEKEFISALSWCIERNRDEVETLKQNAFKKANEFSMDLCSNRMLSLYEDVLSTDFVSRQNESLWHSMMNRIQTEWDMLKNIAEAGEAALGEN